MTGGSAPNRNALWARVLARAWAELGVEHVSLGSGSRSAPLVEAFAGHGGFRLHPHVDERSAAFFALGAGAATGRPAIVVTTSGTAAANLLPAMVEASQSDVPLLAVTADRPARLRGLDANQTILQTRLFGEAPRLTLDLPLPRPEEAHLRWLRGVAARAWAAALGAPPGPVHINVAFEKPLEPTPVPGDVPEGVDLGSGAPAGRAAPRPEPRRSEGAGSALAEALEAARRPLLVVGPARDPAVGPAALALGGRTGAPVVADPLSGARFGPGAADGAVARADLALADAAVARALAPDLVVRVGPAPTSAAVQRYLEGHAEIRQIVVDDGSRWKDHAGTATDVFVADPATTLGGAGEGAAEPDWSDRWRSVEEAVGRVVEEAVDGTWFEGAAAATVAAALPADATWFIGNSMPIRDVDAFAGARETPIRALGFRGASGIDGNVSGALGAAVARGGPAVALLGDLTFLHDVGALLEAGGRDASLQIVVIQNRGGGIFHMLPIREHDPPFTPYIVMPHARDLAEVATAGAIPHRLTPSAGRLHAELEEGFATRGVRILEAPFERADNWERREAVGARARKAAREAL